MGLARPTICVHVHMRVQSIQQTGSATVRQVATFNLQEISQLAKVGV